MEKVEEFQLDFENNVVSAGFAESAFDSKNVKINMFQLPYLMFGTFKTVS